MAHESKEATQGVFLIASPSSSTRNFHAPCRPFMIQFQAEGHTLKYVPLQAISSRRRGGGGGGGIGVSGHPRSI